MKYMIFIAIMSLFFTSGIENFSITDNQKLEWSKVHETNLKTADLHKAIKTQLKAEEISENTFLANIINYDLDYKSLGYKYMDTPAFFRGKLHFEVLIQTKEGRYKATVREITSTSIIDGNIFSVEDLAIKNGDYSKFFKKHLEKVFDYNFNNVTVLIKVDNDW